MSDALEVLRMLVYNYRRRKNGSWVVYLDVDGYIYDKVILRNDEELIKWVKSEFEYDLKLVKGDL